MDLRKFVATAKDFGITDISEMCEVLEKTKNKELRAKSLEVLDDIANQVENWRELIKRIDELMGGREQVAQQQYETEIALLGRVQELSKEAQVEDLPALADAYGVLRYYSVAPGTYVPDNRHTD